MKSTLKEKLLSIAKKEIEGNDSSHDFEHAIRVLKNVEKIVVSEGGDLDILIPAALFHDVVIYPKDHPNSDNAPIESAELVAEILNNIEEFPKEKIRRVCEAIEKCSFGKDDVPDNIETKILRDADKLEATGIISIMRTFASTGQMNRPFYNPDDPFCEKRTPDSKCYGLDLFYSRLLIVPDRMYTKIAREIAVERNTFLHDFIKELKKELEC
tara:strand:+ start:240 stop:878 length:639 start_codon:yes stop_codon:yes gene_type:complete